MHQAGLLRALLIEGLIFALTTLLTYAAAYLASHLFHRLFLRSHPVQRARNQLPLAWLIFNAYLVAGLLYYGALPTSVRALFFTTILFAGLSLLLLGWNRLATRRSPAKPTAAALIASGLSPWIVAWLIQAFARNA